MLDLSTAGTLAFLPQSLQGPVFIRIRETFGREPFPPESPPASSSLTSRIGDSLQTLRTEEGATGVQTDGLTDVLTRMLTDALNRDARRAAAMVSAARAGFERALAAATRLGIGATPWGAPAYPPLLMQIADPPPLLWTRGDAARLALPAVAVIGSRAASPYGLEIGCRLGAELAENGALVVSGLARGVDSAAHRGALTHGPTVAVLGCGVDVVYPREHAALAARIGATGVLVSELPPGTPPRAHHFPRRNRLISGLSLAVVVVEASTRSGSLQTARLALEQGREVMAVPGTILGERNRGCHGLLRDGAKLVERASDILDELKLPWIASPAGPDAAGRLADELAAMRVGEVYEFQQLTEITGLPAGELLRQLLLAEAAGLVLRPGGARFLRVRRPVVR